METFFANPEKSNDDEVASEVGFVCSNSIVTGLLQATSGLLAVLNENRQIIAVNDSLLEMLGIADQKKILGLRPGEALECIHANDEPAGCGTTRWCPTCGAAIAIVASLGTDKPVERQCALSATRKGEKVDIVLNVKSHPIRIDNRRFLLLFLQDVTTQQQRATLERVFYHDLNNIINVLLGASELLEKQCPSDLATKIKTASLRMTREIAFQQCLSSSNQESFIPRWQTTSPAQILDDLKSFFSEHPVAKNKTIRFDHNLHDFPIITDNSVLFRVLFNMVINALEATEENGLVKVWTTKEAEHPTFCVWNANEIPERIALRVFQRNFSTKGQSGRGIGTFSMKLLGEKILGGKVSFSTSQDDGTVFMFSLPLVELQIDSV